MPPRGGGFQDDGLPLVIRARHDFAELRAQSTEIDLLHALKHVESDHRISAKRGVRGSSPHSEGTGDTPGELSFVSLGGLWPGQ